MAKAALPPESHPEHDEAAEELTLAADEQYLNTLTAKASELERKEEEYREKWEALEKQKLQMEFWGTGGWQAMPDDTLFSLTIDIDRNPNAPSEVPVTWGNEKAVYQFKFERGQTYHKIPKQALRVLDQAEVSGHYKEVEHGETVLKPTQFKRFDFRAFPEWN